MKLGIKLTMGILEHPLFHDGAWFHAFSLCDKETGTVASNDILILVVELPGWIETWRESGGQTVARSLDRWLYLMWKAEEIDPAEPPAEVAEGEYREALEIMAAWTKSDIARDEYRRRVDYQRTMAAIKADARKAGLAEGRVEGERMGEQKGRAESERETAKRLKALGVSPDVIVQATGLSKGEVEGL